jgi:hypothetical protein
MLCEALLHILVEERVLSMKKAIETIDTVAELVREQVEDSARRATPRRPRIDAAASKAIESIRASFAIKSRRARRRP